MAGDAGSLPPAAMIISHRVEDWDRWKEAFDRHEDARVAAGALGHHLNRSQEDPDHLTVYFAIADVERAKAFAASEELQEAMKDAGVLGEPEVTWMTPVRESVVWDRELPGVVVTHQVEDFDRWLDAYDAADKLRQRKGIIGHAANRLTDDPATVLVYHQAESFDALSAFLEDTEVQEAMAAAGVTSEPDVSFHTGGWAKSYG